jgi:hypothetical protein
VPNLIRRLQFWRPEESVSFSLPAAASSALAEGQESGETSLSTHHSSLGQAVREQVNNPIFNPQSFTQTLIDEDRGWRSLISGGIRELTWAQIIEHLNTVLDYYRTNPLAFRLVQLQVDHVLGDGMQLKSSDPAIQAEIDRWWHHPLNNLDVRQFDLLTALTLDGEIFVSQHVNPFDGSVYVRLVPAGLIDRIETNPDDLEDEWRYHQTAQPITPDTLMWMPSAIQAEGRWWNAPGIAGLPEIPGQQGVPADLAGGTMRHFAINRPAGVVRGQSDLAPLLPWLRRYRDWLTDRVRLNKYRTAFVWQVQLKGSDARAVRQRQAELAVPPPPGSVIVANENETWTAIASNIHADDVQHDGYALRLMVAAGAGVPLYWLAESEHTARGTAAEQSEPTYRHYRQRQLFFGWVMRRLCVDALRARGLVEVGLDDVLAEFSELDRAESLYTASAMAQLTDTLSTAQQLGWLSPQDAAMTYQHYLGLAMDLPADLDAAGLMSGSPHPLGATARPGGPGGVPSGPRRVGPLPRGRRPGLSSRGARSGGLPSAPGASVRDPTAGGGAVAPDPTVAI